MWGQISCASIYRARLALLVLFTCILKTSSWYDTSSKVDDIRTYGERKQSKEHNPQLGTHTIRHYQRDEDDWLHLMSTLKARQGGIHGKQIRQRLRDHYNNPPVIGQFLPGSAPSDGGTPVRVWGANFGDGTGVYKCRFGRFSVDATFDSTGPQPTINCIAPPFESTKSKSRSVPFSIIIFSNHKDRVDHIASHRRKFRYYGEMELAPLITSVHPLVGPKSGGTTVSFRGSNLRGGSFYNCRFGSDIVPAIFAEGLPSLTSTREHLVCISPRYKTASTVDLDLILSGANSAALLPGFTGYSFTFYDTPKQIRINPSTGTILGGALVLLSSESLRFAALHPNGGPFQCRFGQSVVVSALLTKNGEFACITPPIPRKMRPEGIGENASLIQIEERFRKRRKKLSKYFEHDIVEEANIRVADAHAITLQSAQVVGGRPRKYTRSIADINDLMTSIVTRLQKRIPRWSVCETRFWQGEDSIRRFVHNITSPRVLVYCREYHTIKNIFCDDEVACETTKDDQKLLEYSCSTMRALGKKYFKACPVQDDRASGDSPHDVTISDRCPAKIRIDVAKVPKAPDNTLRISWELPRNIAREPLPGSFSLCIAAQTKNGRVEHIAQRVLKTIAPGRSSLIVRPMIPVPKHATAIIGQILYVYAGATGSLSSCVINTPMQICGNSSLIITDRKPKKRNETSHAAKKNTNKKMIIIKMGRTFFPIYANISLVRRPMRGGLQNYEGLQIRYFVIHDDNARTETSFNLICVYEMQQTNENGPPKPIFVDGWRTKYSTPGKLDIPSAARYAVGKKFTIRYEHKLHKNDSCCWEWPKYVTKNGETLRRDVTEVDLSRNWTSEYAEADVFGSLSLEWPENTVAKKNPLTHEERGRTAYIHDSATRNSKRNVSIGAAAEFFSGRNKCKMIGNPPTNVSVEVSLNGQQFHPVGKFIYFDESYIPDVFKDPSCSLSSQKTLSFSPVITNLGSHVRISGLTPEHLKECGLGVFNRQEVQVSPSEAPLHGGTDIIVSGFVPVPGLNYSCRFQDLYVPANVRSDNKLSCKTPPYAVPRTVSFAVSVMTSSSTELTAWSYDAQIGLSGDAEPKGCNSVHNYESRKSPAPPETDATKDDISFNFEPQLKVESKNNCMQCRIGGHQIDGFYDAGTNYLGEGSDIYSRTRALRAPSVMCPLPTCLKDNITDMEAISLIMNGKEFNDFAFQKPIIRILDPPELVELLPESASVADPISFTVREVPESVLIIFLHFGSHTSVRCRSDGIVSTKFSCEGGVPLLRPGVYQIRLSFNRNNLSPPTCDFVYRNKLHPYYASPARITTVPDFPVSVYTYSYQFSPNAGPTQGGTQIVFVGKHFGGGSNYKCRFGGIVVPAWFRFVGGALGRLLWYKKNKFIHGQARGSGPTGTGGGRDGQITCYSPAVKMSGHVPVCISLDGTTWSHDTFDGFYYYNNKGNRRLERNIGSPLGGSQLIVFGSLVAQMALTKMQFTCKFQSIRTVGIYDYKLHALRCVNPPGIDGSSVPLSISVNDQQYEYIDQMEYAKDIEFLDVTRGPSTGGTKVRIRDFASLVSSDSDHDDIKTAYKYLNLLKKTRKTDREKLKKLRALKIDIAARINDSEKALLEIRSTKHKRQSMLRSALEEAAITRKIHTKHYIGVENAKTKYAEAMKHSKQLKSQLHEIKVEEKKLIATFGPLNIKLLGWQRVYNAMARRRIIKLSLHRYNSTFVCKFGDQPDVLANISGPSLACKTPPSSQLGTVDFQVVLLDKSGRINVEVNRNREAWDRIRYTPKFQYHGTLKLQNRPTLSTELGGELLHLPGVNFTGTSEYFVKFGRFVVTGIFDAHADSIVVKVPPLKPGPVVVKISSNKRDYTVATSLHFVFFSLRVSVQRSRLNSNELTIRYAGTKNRLNKYWQTNVTKVYVEYTTISKDGEEDAKSQTGMIKQETYGRFRWQIKHSVSDDTSEIRLLRFILHVSSSKQKKCTEYESAIKLTDDNKGRGWAWRRRRAPSGHNDIWSEAASSIKRSKNDVVLLNLTHAETHEAIPKEELVGTGEVSEVNNEQGWIRAEYKPTIKSLTKGTKAVDNKIKALDLVSGGNLPGDTYVSSVKNERVYLRSASFQPIIRATKDATLAKRKALMVAKEDLFGKELALNVARDALASLSLSEFGQNNKTVLSARADLLEAKVNLTVEEAALKSCTESGRCTLETQTGRESLKIGKRRVEMAKIAVKSNENNVLVATKIEAVVAANASVLDAMKSVQQREESFLLCKNQGKCNENNAGEFSGMFIGLKPNRTLLHFSRIHKQISSDEGLTGEGTSMNKALKVLSVSEKILDAKKDDDQMDKNVIIKKEQRDAKKKLSGDRLVCGLDPNKPTVTRSPGKKIFTVIGQHDSTDGSVTFQSPQGLPDGTLEINLHRCGSLPSSEGGVRITADNRYKMKPSLSFHLCFAEEGLRNARQPLPSSGVARKRFDSQVIFDISEALGMARDRFSVKNVHVETGVVEVECISSRSEADTTCHDAKFSLNKLIENYGSIIYDGVVTWALDPLCPHGRIKFVDGIPHYTGQCSDPALMTKYECLEAGTCEGIACGDFNTKEKCEKHSSIYDESCRWETKNKFDDTGDFKVFQWFKCSNPSLKNKQTCLAEGKCSDKTKLTREDCLREVKCDFGKGFEKISELVKTREECENPGLLTGSLGSITELREKQIQYVCTAPECAPEGLNYNQAFKTREQCEVPGSRDKIAPIPVDLKESDLRCCRPKGGAPFDYAQFETKKLCEIPCERCSDACSPDAGNALERLGQYGLPKSALAKSLSAPKNTGCVQRKDVDYKEAIVGRKFQCEQFPTKETCEEPTKRCNLMLPGCVKYNPEKFGVHMARVEWNVPKYYPDLSVPPTIDGIKTAWGPPCEWKTDFEFPPSSATKGDSLPSYQNEENKMRYKSSAEFLQLQETFFHREVYCKFKRYGPSGCWQESGHTCQCDDGFKEGKENMNREDATRDPRKACPGIWEPAKPGGPKPEKSEEDSELSPVELSSSLLRSVPKYSSSLSTKNQGQKGKMEGMEGEGEKGERERKEGMEVKGEKEEKEEEDKEKMKDKLEDIMSSDNGLDPPKVDADCDPRNAKPNVPCKPGKATSKNEWTPKNEILNEGESRPNDSGGGGPPPALHGASPGSPGGPGCAGPTSGVHKIERLKEEKDMISAYQSYVVVGGQELWMNLDTAVATTWVMSAACGTDGCNEIPLFSGFFIPFAPAKQVIIDMEYARDNKRGEDQQGGLKGFLGYSFVQIAGHMALGAPIAMAIKDTGPEVLGVDHLGEGKFNHSGAVSFGFWDDNINDYKLGPGGDQKDPALDLITFMYCGNIFYPAGGTDLPTAKPFELWGVPPFMPTAMVWKFSFYYGDKGGCLFMDPGMNVGGKEMYMAGGGLKWVMVMPTSTKFSIPSWLFVVSDAKVRGKSVEPCAFGACKGSVHTGRFPIIGPEDPVNRLLEEAAADYMCQNLHELPDIAFTIMGIEFTMGWENYVVIQNKFGNKKCATAIVPHEVQVMSSFAFWIFGDLWVRSFYSVFERLPLRRIGFAKTDHRYYEANGCVCGEGKGPIESVPPAAAVSSQNLEEKAKHALENDLASAMATIGTKAGIEGGGANQAGNENEKNAIAATEHAMRTNHKTGTPSNQGYGMRFKMESDRHCPAGMRFTGAECVKQSVMTEMLRIQKFHKARWEQRKKEMMIKAKPRSLTSQFYSSDDKSIRISDVGVPIDSSMLQVAESTSTRRKRSRRTRKRPSNNKEHPLYFGPYTPLHPKKCPASDNIFVQESHFFRHDGNVGKEKKRSRSSALLHAAAAHIRRTKASVRTAFVEEDHAEQIHLPTEQVAPGGKRMAQLFYNVSKLYHQWAKEGNISDNAMKKYWHGETERHMFTRRSELTASWKQMLQNARKHIASDKVKQMMNHRVMLRLADQISDPYWQEKFVDTEEDREIGDQVNEEDAWGLKSYPDEKDPFGLVKSSATARRKVHNSTKRKRVSALRFLQQLRSNGTMAVEQVKKSIERYPSLWNASSGMNQTIIHKLHAEDGAWKNLSHRERYMNVYHAISAEHQDRMKKARERLDDLEETYAKHNATFGTPGPEIVSHVIRDHVGWFNKSTGRVILGGGRVGEVSDEE